MTGKYILAAFALAGLLFATSISQAQAVREFDGKAVRSARPAYGPSVPSSGFTVESRYDRDIAGQQDRAERARQRQGQELAAIALAHAAAKAGAASAPSSGNKPVLRLPHVQDED